MKISKNNMLTQGAILAVAGIIVRLIGMFYRIPVANIIGDEGNGVYSVAYNVYNVALVLSSYGIPIAVSKMISHSLACNEYKNTKRIFSVSVCFACFMGGVAALLIYFGADWLATNVYSGYAGIEFPLRVLAPTIFVVALLGVIRGFFQGHANMVPTAVSQIIEQIVNALVSIIAAYVLVGMHIGSPKLAGYGAMGATLGTCLGAVAALVCVFVWFAIKKNTLQSATVCEQDVNIKPYKDILSMILLTTIPIMIGQTFYQISAVFDDIIYGKLMAYRGFAPESIAAGSGVYNSIYVLMTSIPMGIASAMASSALPNVVKAYAKNDIEDANKKIYMVIKFNMLIAIPSAIGLMVMGEPIVRMLFPRLDYVTGGMMLRVGGIGVIFYALSTISSSVLQAIDKVNKPVVHSAISLAFHIPLIVALFLFTNLNAMALVIGYMTFPMVVGLLNFKEIKRTLGYKQEIKKTFVITGECAVFMGICTYCTYWILSKFNCQNTISVMGAMVIAMVTYFGSMKLMKNL